MLNVIEHAVDAAVGLTGATAYDVYLQLRSAQADWGKGQGYPPLLSQFGTSLVERALIEAVCRSRGVCFSDVLRADAFGVRLEDFDQRLSGFTPAELLPAPRQTITARHTVGMVDPLTAADVAVAERLDDGLPQSLDACIRYDLSHYKLKVGSDVEVDLDRLQRISRVIALEGSGPFSFSLDGNECFNSLAQFRDWWAAVADEDPLRPFMENLLFVEQPFHRDIALDPAALGALRNWADRPPIIIDESDAEPGSAVRALELGYQGTSHKNCKGVFKSVANACLLEKMRRDSPDTRLLMSGEDLCNIGPVAPHQDLAVAAALGIDSVERNGHHYFAGLSAFPAAVRQQVLAAHSDLYRPTAAGWPTVVIAGGRIDLGSVNLAPFGVGFELDLEPFADVQAWRAARLKTETR